MEEKDFSDGFRRAFLHWDCFWSTRESVYDGDETVKSPAGGSGPTMSTLICSKRAETGSNLPMALVVWREIFPFWQAKQVWTHRWQSLDILGTHIYIYTHILAAYHIYCCTNSRMSEVVKTFKDRPSEMCRNERTITYSRGIAEKFATRQKISCNFKDVSLVDNRFWSSGSHSSSFVISSSLMSGNGDSGDGRDSRKQVGRLIVLSRDVTDIRC